MTRDSPMQAKWEIVYYFPQKTIGSISRKGYKQWQEILRKKIKKIFKNLLTNQTTCDII